MRTKTFKLLQENTCTPTSQLNNHDFAGARFPCFPFNYGLSDAVGANTFKLSA